MDLSQLPINERLDALINRFENSDSESDFENNDYHQFVDRQAANVLRRDIAPDAPETSSKEPDLFLGSDVNLGSDLDFGSDPELDPYAVDALSGSDAFDDAVDASNSKKTENSKKTHDEIIQSIYKEAGISLASDDENNAETNKGRSERPRKRTAKQIERDREAAARTDLQMEREFAPEVGTHTLKTFTIKDFLEDLDANSSDDEPKQRKDTFSSPPRPQAPLMDFLSSPRSRSGYNRPLLGDNRTRSGDDRARLGDDRARLGDDRTRLGDDRSHSGNDNEYRGLLLTPAGTDGAASDDDGGLEIIPETKMTKLSRPVRDMLKFAGNKAGGTISDRRLASEWAKLAHLEQKQVLERRQRNRELLAAQGVDVDAINEEISSKQRQKAGGAAALLAQEQQKADELRRIEKARRHEEGDSDVESEFNSDDEEPELVVRRKLISDDEDEEDDDNTKGRINNHNNNSNSSNNNNDDNSNTDSDSNADLGTEQANKERGAIKASKFDFNSTATQYLPPVSSDALDAIMGLDEHGEPEAGREETMKDLQTDTLDDNAETLPDSLGVFGTQGSLDEDLEIVRNDTVRREIVTPDLTGINRLPPDQRLALVRQRYLEAKAEQRRQSYFEKQQDEQNQQKKQQKSTIRSKLAGGKFVEDQAEESDDEENDVRGLRRRMANGEDDEGDDGENNDENDADLEDLVDKNGNVKINSNELKRRFLEEEKLRDQKLLNKFVDGVHGGFRRRRQRAQMGDQFLSDDDLEFSDEETNHRLLIEAQRKSNLLKSNQQVAQLAGNQKAAAFFTSISEDLVSRPQGKRGSIQEGLDFLRSFDQVDYRRRSANDVTDLGSDNEFQDNEDSSSYNFLGSSGARAGRNMSVSRPRTILERSKQIVQGRTYAARISSSELTGTRDVEITATLGRVKKASKPKTRYIAPPLNIPNPKRRPVIATKFQKASWD